MKLRFTVLSILLLSCCGIARSQQISQTQTHNGYDYTIKISDDDLVSTPSWNPETENPAPVTLRKAIEITRVNLKRFVLENTEKWDVQQVTLHQMGKDKWLYEVVFYCFLARCGAGANDGFTLYMKMDGTIVEPEKTVAKKQ